MRAENLPPSRRSTVLAVVCQSSEAAFHCLTSSGAFQAAQTAFRSALTRASTVIFIWVPPCSPAQCSRRHKRNSPCAVRVSTHGVPLHSGAEQSRYGGDPPV